MAEIFDVIADVTRRRLLRSLLERSRNDGEVNVGELVAELELSQPTVSKHLKVLRDHGLVTVREEGQHRFYRLDPEPLSALEDWMAPFREPLAAPDDAAVHAIDHEVEPAPRSAAWTGAEAGARAVGRVAADAAHQARAVIDTTQEKFQAVEEKLGRGRKRAADNIARFAEKFPLGGSED